MPSPRVAPAATLVAVTASLFVAPMAVAQRQVRAEVPIQVQGTILEEPPPLRPGYADPGPTVRMLESPNVDRFLLRAQDFLGREDWSKAILVLQDVIEGRTLEEMVEDAGAPAVAVEPAAPETPTGPGGRTVTEPELASDDPWRLAGESSTQSVFSADTRLFRPVQRLCHELLGSMPAAGIAWYRAQFEVAAERLLNDGLAERDAAALQAVYERFFLTRSAGQAMRAAADLLMDQGRFRAAHQAYRQLIDVYPASLAKEAGMDELWVRARLTLCLAMLGERASTAAAITEMEEHHPDDSLRIEGELVPVNALAQSALFDDIRIAAAPVSLGTSALAGGDDVPVPLFEVRFSDPQPYRPGRNQNDDGRVFFLGNDTDGLAATPKYTDFQPGGSVLLLPGDGPDRAELVFLDHFRLTSMELPTGRLQAVTDGAAMVPAPTPGTPRIRIPAYDWPLLRVAVDQDRLFTVTGAGNVRLSGMKALTRTTLEARNRGDLALLWSTADSADLRDCCFLAAPVPDGGKLYIPAMTVGTFWLLALDANDGSIVFRTPLHREGTEFTKPPAVPVVLDAGTAYVLTNAGAVAAVDTLSGAIKWIRRYERVDPLRYKPRAVAREQRMNAFGGNVFRELSVDGFAPSDLILHEGLVVLAPTDGEQLICLDGSTGETHWRCERLDIQYVMGVDGDTLFLGGSDSVTAIHLTSGVRLWHSEVPSFDGSAIWRGRGTVAGGLLLVPGDRCVHVMPTRDGQGWATIGLPSFRLGLDPLGGYVNLFAKGPWIAAVHSGGIEVFSTLRALHSIADELDDPMRRGSLLAQAGELVAAVDALESVDLTARPELRKPVGERMLALCSEISLAYAARGARDKAIATLDRAHSRLGDPMLAKRWHLARIEMFHALGDLDAMADEQQTLYKLMETGG